jgi:hypothetical protein
MLPLVRSSRLLKDRFDWADRLTSPTVDALLRIDIELLFLFKLFGLVLGRMNAIHRTHIYTSGILYVDARLGNNVGHLILLASGINLSSKSTSASQLNQLETHCKSLPGFA